MSDTLVSIRSAGEAIKGVINLAMVLGDAPLATMTGEEWDRALRTKVQEAITSSLDSKLARSGLSRLRTHHLSRILEAAFLKSTRQLQGRETKAEEAVLVTGLEMFEKGADGVAMAVGQERMRKKKNREQLFWPELPEFSHLTLWKGSGHPAEKGKALPLREKLAFIFPSEEGDAEGSGLEERLCSVVRPAFLAYLAETLGFDTGPAGLDVKAGMGMGAGMGMDSLSAVGGQYWCFRGLSLFLLP
ncbi:MAG: hypothetical protein Q9196_007478 [Gyalolechia fulgens]